MAYNSTLPTPKIESALLSSLKTKKIEYNITQDKSSNYASLAEAIAAVDDNDYKTKGIVLTFYTGTEWVSKRYNGEDASGFATEANWVDAGGAAGGTQYLDLSPLFEIIGDPVSTVTDEFLAELKKAYEEKYSVALTDGVNTPLNIAYAEGTYTLAIEAFVGNSNNYTKYLHQFKISETDKSVQFSTTFVNLTYEGAGTKALTDSGQYVDFAVPTRVIKNTGGGPVTSELSPNILYKFGERPSLTITLGGGTVGIVNEYMFEFRSGTTATTLSVPNSVKWSGGNALTIEANKTYQVSIVDNLAVYAAF